MNPLLITIASTPAGYYRWELRHGPDGTFEYAASRLHKARLAP